MAGESPKRSIRISEEDWTQLQAEAAAAGKSASAVLLDAWRASQPGSRKIPRLYFASQLEESRQYLAAALKRIDKLLV